jgi:hypothetical protein
VVPQVLKHVQVLALIEDQMRRVNQKIDALLLVGGFAGSEYLRQRVEVCPLPRSFYCRLTSSFYRNNSLLEPRSEYQLIATPRHYEAQHDMALRNDL